MDAGAGYIYSEKNFVFDRHKLKRLSFSDLFNDESIPRLRNIIKDAIIQKYNEGKIQGLDEETVNENKFPLHQDNFGLLDEGLSILFDKYDIACGADGVVQIIIPYSEISFLLKPEIQKGIEQ